MPVGEENNNKNHKLLVMKVYIWQIDITGDAKPNSLF